MNQLNVAHPFFCWGSTINYKGKQITKVFMLFVIENRYCKFESIFRTDCQVLEANTVRIYKFKKLMPGSKILI